MQALPRGALSDEAAELATAATTIGRPLLRPTAGSPAAHARLPVSPPPHSPPHRAQLPSRLDALPPLLDAHHQLLGAGGTHNGSGGGGDGDGGRGRHSHVSSLASHLGLVDMSGARCGRRKVDACGRCGRRCGRVQEV
eukprot:362396-Chlamydomonas_euryale.AAC.4